jgi:UDP-2-acetamido-3-amino-2,3-dideoxy-glucuronate N-acetyltransferase
MPNCKIGDKCNIGQNVVISPDVVIGNNVKIQNNVSVYSGVVLEDDVFCGPSMVFTNINNPRSEIIRRDQYARTLVRKGASMGANCTIVCGSRVGEFAFVAAGAVVTKDVPPYALMVGVPARKKGWVCRCGVPLPAATTSNTINCPSCGNQYQEEAGMLEPIKELQAQEVLS